PASESPAAYGVDTPPRTVGSTLLTRSSHRSPLGMALRLVRDRPPPPAGLATNSPRAASPKVSPLVTAAVAAELPNAGYVQTRHGERRGVHSQRSFGVAMPRWPNLGHAVAQPGHDGERPDSKRQ